jgi:hypothetical protein
MSADAPGEKSSDFLPCCLGLFIVAGQGAFFRLRSMPVPTDPSISAPWGFAGYPRDEIERVWIRAETVIGNDPALWRKDEHGAWMYRLDYGNRHSPYGWEIWDASLGRADQGIAAFRALQWQNYLDHIAAEPNSRITADGLRNVRQLL